MILYGAPGACSQASHIALIEAGLPFRLVKVGRDKQTEDKRDFTAINPKGYTPALELDDGTILTESLAILVYIAERSGQLLAKAGPQRWRALEATEFMTTELHGNFRPFFHQDAPAQREKAGQALQARFATLDAQLGDQAFLLGPEMSIADCYLFVMLSWAAMMGIAVPPRFAAYTARLRARPAVAQALAAEGL